MRRAKISVGHGNLDALRKALENFDRSAGIARTTAAEPQLMDNQRLRDNEISMEDVARALQRRDCLR